MNIDLKKKHSSMFLKILKSNIKKTKSRIFPNRFCQLASRLLRLFFIIGTHGIMVRFKINCMALVSCGLQILRVIVMYH